MSRQPELGRNKTRTHVVAGILRRRDREVLITDRLRSASMQDLWEFPGGKVKTGESPAGALQRELAEELGISNLEFAHFRQVEHDYPELHVLIDFFIVSGWRGMPAGIEGQQLRWIDVDKLDSALLLPADAPVVVEFRNSLHLSKY